MGCKCGARGKAKRAAGIYRLFKTIGGYDSRRGEGLRHGYRGAGIESGGTAPDYPALDFEVPSGPQSDRVGVERKIRQVDDGRQRVAVALEQAPPLGDA